MKLRSFFLILAGVVVVLLSVAGGSFYWILSQSPLSLPLGNATARPSATIFVPKQTPVMMSLLTNPDGLEIFGQMAVPAGQRRRARAEFERLERGLLANTGVDYDRDIKPWLGDEVTFALTSRDFDRNAKNGVQPGYLLIAGSKDGELAREFLQLLYSQEAIAGTGDLVFEPYKGVTLIYRRALEDGKITSASTVVGDRFVLFANHPKVLREALNNVQAANLSLEADPTYQRALQTIQAPRIAVGVINLPLLSAWIANRDVASNAPAQTLTLTLDLNRQGLVAQTALAGVLGETQVAPTLSAPVKALNYIPSSATLTAAGTNLQRLSAELGEGLPADTALAQIFQQSLATLNASLELDVAGDIFRWTTGEYALSLLPDSTSPQNKQKNWLFVAEKNTPEAEEAIAALDRLAKAQGLSLGELSLGDRRATVWTELKTATDNQPASLDARVKGVRATVGNYEIFSNSLAAMEQALADGETSVLANRDFQTAIAQLPRKNNGYLYFDWKQTQPLLEEKIPLFRVLEFAGKPLFRNLQAIALSSSGRDNGISRASIFFQLGLGD